jgi:UDP-N-acetylmuramoylalanine--D-glutamate ligase
MLLKKPLILGFGQTGKALANYFESQHIPYFVTDQKEGYSHEEAITLDFDLLIVSPGIPKTNLVYAHALKMGICCVGEIELALQLLNIPVIGITGTNGKTTVTKLVSEGLNFLGIKAAPCGNYGVPLISFVGLQDQYQALVCELSSYQLETVSNQKLAHSVILNVTQDHLDRYASIEVYALAKWKIFDLTLPVGRCIVNCAILEEFHFESTRELISFGKGFLKNGSMSCECQLFLELMEGKASSKEMENWIAAFLLLEPYGMTAKKMTDLLESFEKPMHRIEFVKEIDQIRFYDDSKGTNVDAVIFAVEKFNQPLLLLVGGKDKQSNYHPWIEALKGKVKCMIAFGQAKEKMQKDLSSHFSFLGVDTLEEATRLAFEKADQGDVVLLSPGCSSFDAFKDYQHRGETFKQTVKTLLERKR